MGARKREGGRLPQQRCFLILSQKRELAMKLCVLAKNLDFAAGRGGRVRVYCALVEQGGRRFRIKLVEVERLAA